MPEETSSRIAVDESKGASLDLVVVNIAGTGGGMGKGFRAIVNSPKDSDKDFRLIECSLACRVGSGLGLNGFAFEMDS